MEATVKPEMNLKDEYTKAFQDFLSKYPDFENIYDIIDRNSSKKGRNWIIGSFVYKNLIRKIHGIDIPEEDEIDIDFISEKPKRDIYKPRGWKIQRTAWGNLYLSKEPYRIDFNDLSTFIPLYRKGLEPTIKNFLDISPLNINGIAYDCENEKLISGSVKGKGYIGFNAIKNKKIIVNDYEEAESFAKHKELSVEELVKQIAEELGFDHSLRGIPKET